MISNLQNMLSEDLRAGMRDFDGALSEKINVAGSDYDCMLVEQGDGDSLALEGNIIQDRIQILIESVRFQDSIPAVGSTVGRLSNSRKYQIVSRRKIGGMVLLDAAAANREEA